MRKTQRFSGERLRSMRLRRGLTQSQLARRADVREQQIVRWEGGKGKRGPAADAIGVLAGALECEVSEFFTDSPAGASSGDDEDEESDSVASELRRIAVEAARRGDDSLASQLLRVAARTAVRS